LEVWEATEVNETLLAAVVSTKFPGTAGGAAD
jgi:hypothetical protein